MFGKAFSFNGRIKRTEYGITTIIYWGTYIAIRYLIEGNGPVKIAGLLFIPLFWFYWAQGAKRCHDMNKSGWWQIIPFYGLWMLFQKGDPWPNQYDDGGSTQVFYGAEDYEKPFVIDEPADGVVPPGNVQ